MVGMVASLVLLIALVKFWPILTDDGPDLNVYSTRGQDIIPMEEIVQTTQAQQAPPPPAPLPPIVVPDDEIIEQEELDITDSFLAIEDPGLDQEVLQGDQNPPTQFARAQTGPKVVRITEPEYTREARRKKIRAEVVVEVLVDAQGKVQESKILDRFLLSKDRSREQVAELGYGLEQSALDAAGKCFFRPAREDGKRVSSYATLTFSFGL